MEEGCEASQASRALPATQGLWALSEEHREAEEGLSRVVTYVLQHKVEGATGEARTLGIQIGEVCLPHQPGQFPVSSGSSHLSPALAHGGLRGITEMNDPQK